MGGSITRRGVLGGAAALAGVAALPPIFAPISARGAIGHVVVDDRLAPSAAFAGAVHAAVVHHVDALEDLCNRWYTGLRRQVRADAGSIAGLTSWMDYVVMHGCAAEIGYHGTFHAAHLPGTRFWPRALGAALADGAHLRSGFMPAQVYDATLAAAATGQLRMVTWVFSPRS